MGKGKTGKSKPKVKAPKRGEKKGGEPTSKKVGRLRMLTSFELDDTFQLMIDTANHVKLNVYYGLLFDFPDMLYRLYCIIRSKTTTNQPSTDDMEDDKLECWQSRRQKQNHKCVLSQNELLQNS